MRRWESDASGPGPAVEWDEDESDEECNEDEDLNRRIRGAHDRWESGDSDDPDDADARRVVSGRIGRDTMDTRGTKLLRIGILRSAPRDIFP